MNKWGKIKQQQQHQELDGIGSKRIAGQIYVHREVYKDGIMLVYLLYPAYLLSLWNWSYNSSWIAIIFIYI